MNFIWYGEGNIVGFLEFNVFFIVIVNRRRS